MRNPFRRKKNNGIHIVRLSSVERFTCEHYKNIFDYGGHPKRVYAVCLNCPDHPFMLLSWPDAYGRAANRIIATLPALFSLVMLVVTVIIIVITFIAYLPVLR